MEEFLQSYGALIFLGLLFSLMLWGHVRGHGAGCCGGGHKHEPETQKKKDEQGNTSKQRLSLGLVRKGGNNAETQKLPQM